MNGVGSTVDKELGRWLKVLVDQYCDGSDFNDSDEVQGRLGATLAGDMLTVNYDPDKGSPTGPLAPAAVERYRLVPVE